jgi:hypothetical protein
MVGLLTEVLLRGLPTRDDRVQEDRLLVLDERHQVHVLLALDDDALAGVTVRVRVLQDVEQVPTLDVKTMSSNPMPRSALSFAFFASSQAKYSPSSA